jgi:ubiquinone/menaquinone biosynthesis C-methylase UbiE
MIRSAPGGGVNPHALDLPFAAAEFDVVLCQFGAMFFPDKIKGFREALRVLCPGGLLLGLWLGRLVFER